MTITTWKSSGVRLTPVKCIEAGIRNGSEMQRTMGLTDSQFAKVMETLRTSGVVKVVRGVHGCEYYLRESV
jgi:DNA-binding IscR family transcriptional regulator